MVPTGKVRITQFIEEGKPPSGFHHHDRWQGRLSHQCVFCKKEVGHTTRIEHGYYIELHGPVPVPIGREIEIQNRSVECTICLNCDDDIRSAEEGVEDSTEVLERLHEFIIKGMYPKNIIEYSLEDNANNFCFLCKHDVSNEDHQIHYIPTGYYRNELEPNSIPGPLSICERCEEEINSSKREGNYKWLDHYSIDVCCSCGDAHFISKAEEHYRIQENTKGQYLCSECALEKGLMGMPRMIHPKCSECQKNMDTRKDVLFKSTYETRLHNFYCTSCESNSMNLLVFDIQEVPNRKIRVEVFKNGHKWKWQLTEAFSSSNSDDQIILKSSKIYEESWVAMYDGVSYSIQVLSAQLKLNL